MEEETYDSMKDTLEHIKTVNEHGAQVLENLRARYTKHDLSKLNSPEKEVFDEYTPKLKGSTYGSKEYAEFLKGMKVALDHHYENNDHHPEYNKHIFCRNCETSWPIEEGSILKEGCPLCESTEVGETGDISAMSLMSLMEMITDWKSATLRHDDGDINKSIVINQKRFGYSDEIRQIFTNTIKELGWENK